MASNLLTAKEKLEKFLKCVKCSIVSKGCYYGPCQHIFCKHCINTLRTKCTLCTTPVRKFATNERIDEIITQLDNMKKLLGYEDDHEHGIKIADDSFDDDLPSAEFATRTNSSNVKSNEPSTAAAAGAIAEAQSKKPITLPRNIEKRNCKGETALHVATNAGDLERVATLIQGGANVNTKDNAGWMPLHEAALKGHTEILHLLLENGAYVNEPGMHKITALHDAVILGKTDMVEHLLRRGADVYAKNDEQLTPMDLACSFEMVAMLQNAAPRRTENAPARVGKVATRTTKPIVKKKYVFATTGLTWEQISEIEDCARVLNAEFTVDVDERTTHLIAKCVDENNCPRTLKYMHAVAQGKWIVKFDWIVESINAERWVDEKPYEFEGCGIHPNNNAPRIAREHRENKLGSLLFGCNVFFFGDFSEPSKEELIGLAQSCGAKILTREPRLLSARLGAFTPFQGRVEKELEKCSHYILYQKTEPPIKHKNSNLRTFHVKFLMNSISKFELNLGNAY